MQYLSKRRGVISVFLLIIFVATYVFVGLVVDAGRYKMAEAYTEAALDNASNSILASYNRLLFDLYGLFSVDLGATDQENMEKKIEELYNRYLDETLGLVKTDVSQYRTALSDAFDQIFLNHEDAALDTSQLYDFKITKLDVGSTVTLADSANVESQIIEYMKFRAPVQLVDDMGGFLEKIGAILSIEERVRESLIKVGIMEKYDTLPEKAQELLKDIRAEVAFLYNYSIHPDENAESLFSAGWPQDVYAENPFRLKSLAEDFDQQLQEADDTYEESMREEKDRQAMDLSVPVGNLRNYIIEEKIKGNDWELTLHTFYDAAGDGGKTQNFTEISLEVLEQDKIYILAEEVNTAIEKKKEEEGYPGCEGYEEFLEGYQQYLENNGEGAIEQKRRDDYDKARQILKNRLDGIESTAGEIYDQMDNLYDRVIETADSYQSYIGELKAELEKNPNSENKKTVYLPEIELAQSNLGEVLKNLDIIKNSRQYLEEIGYGSLEDSEKREKLSAWMPPLADLVMQNRLEQRSDQSQDNTLVGEIGSNDNYKDANGSKDLYQNPYVQATVELLPTMQGDLCSVYSLSSYYREMYYRKDVDISMNDTIENVKQNGKALGTDQYQSEANPQESDQIKLDNEAMRKDADYPNYLTVNYLRTEAVSEEEANFSFSETENVDVGTMKNVLENGLSLISMLGNLLEGARDNLYVDAYVMSMLPNYYDYRLLVNGKEKDISTNAFMKEYQKYAASYAEVEYIITGAGATGGRVFGEKIKAPEGEEMAEGFGKLSVSAMRGKLFGTRLLLNCLAMFTDSAKYSQASSICSIAGPFAPLATVVLMVAWAVAETILDVMILMGEMELSKAPNGEVAIFKQGDSWFFSLEGVAKELVNLAVNKLSNTILDQLGNVTNNLEKELNIMIAQAYESTNSSVNGILDEIKGQGSKISDWSGELIENIGKAESEGTQDGNAGLQAAKTMAQNMNNELEKTFSDSIDGVKDKFNSVTDSVKENAVIAVSRAKDALMEKADTMIGQAGDQAKEFINKNIEKLIPTGRVVHTGSNAITMGYKDYLYFYLFTMDKELKIKRIQSVIQANLRVGGQKGFLMETAPASVWADLEVSMKYLFLSNILVPEGLRKDGRLRLKVISSQSY